MFQINAAQAEALAEVLRDHNDGEPVEFSRGHDGTLTVDFTIATVQIKTTGETEDN